MEIDELQEGEKVLFNERKIPLEVQQTGDKVIVEGPNGGEYEIYRDNDALLVCRKGNRRYSSYCRNLRKTGEWNREDDKWTHSKTEVEIRVEEDGKGFWRVESEKFEADNPKYGFSSKEAAIKEAEKIVTENPCG